MRAVFCPELDKIYKSATAAANELNISRSAICNVCNGNRKTTGRHPKTNEKLTWKYVNNDNRNRQSNQSRNGKNYTNDIDIMHILLDKMDQMQQKINDLNEKVEESNTIIKEQESKFDKINNNYQKALIDTTEEIEITEELIESTEEIETTEEVTDIDKSVNHVPENVVEEEKVIKKVSPLKGMKKVNLKVDNSVSIKDDSYQWLKNNIFDSEEDFDNFMKEADKIYNETTQNIFPSDEESSDETKEQKDNNKSDLILPTAEELGLNDEESYEELNEQEDIEDLDLVLPIDDKSESNEKEESFKLNDNYNKPKAEEKESEKYQPNIDLPDTGDLFSCTDSLFD